MAALSRSCHPNPWHSGRYLLSDSSAAHITYKPILEPGTVLAGKYLLLEKLGQGGMGIVWKAQNTISESIVCVKVLHDEQALERSVLQRFQRESKALAKLVENPHIVKVNVFDVTERPFLVTNFIEGTSLNEILRKEGALPEKRAWSIFAQLVDALAYAHSAGVIHRDIKPANVMISESNGEPFVTLIDFGVASISVDGEAFQRLTKTGALVGSPEYMSPEQYSGQKIEARSDIYSLGCLMFTALAGIPPFEGDNAFEICMQHVRADRNHVIKRLQRSALAPIIMRCIAVSPEDRYANAREIKTALLGIEQQIGTGPISATNNIPATVAKTSTSNSRKVKPGIAMVALLVIVGVIWASATFNQTLESCSNGFATGGVEKLEKSQQALERCFHIGERVPDWLPSLLPDPAGHDVARRLVCILALGSIAAGRSSDARVENRMHNICAPKRFSDLEGFADVMKVESFADLLGSQPRTRSAPDSVFSARSLKDMQISCQRADCLPFFNSAMTDVMRAAIRSNIRENLWRAHNMFDGVCPPAAEQKLLLESAADHNLSPSTRALCLVVDTLVCQRLLNQKQFAQDHANLLALANDLPMDDYATTKEIAKAYLLSGKEEQASRSMQRYIRATSAHDGDALAAAKAASVFAESYTEMNQPKKAELYFLQLAALIPRINNNAAEQMRLYYILGDHYSAIDRWEQARRHYESAKRCVEEIADKFPSNTVEHDIHLARARIAAMTMLQEAANGQDSAGTAEITTFVSETKFGAESYAYLIDFAVKALERCHKRNMSDALALAGLAEAPDAAQKAKLEELLATHYDATHDKARYLRLAKNLATEPVTNDVLYANCHLNLAVAAVQQNDIPVALYWLDHWLQTAKNPGNQLLATSQILSVKACCKYAAGQHTEARQLLDECRTAAENLRKIDRLTGLAELHVYYSLAVGWLLDEKGQKTWSHEELEKALQLARTDCKITAEMNDPVAAKKSKTVLSRLEKEAARCGSDQESPGNLVQGLHK